MEKISSNLRVNLSLAIVTALLGMVLILGGTFAYFNDLEDTENTFTSGTLALTIEPEDGDLHFQVENMKPGEADIQNLKLLNEGTLDFKDVKLSVAYQILDADGNDGSEEFANLFLISIYDNSTKKYIVESISLNDLGEVTLAEGFSSGEEKDLQVHIEFSELAADDSSFIGYQIDFELLLEAIQQDGDRILTNN